MSYPYGVRKKVIVFVLDDELLQKYGSINWADLLAKGKPDIVANGSKNSCGREVVRRLVELGFLHPIKDLVPLALGLDIAAFGEFERMIEEQKKNGKIESTPI